jgi:Domain of unknown function (DUF4349)
MKTVYLLLSMGILLSCGNSENKISESISNSPTADYIIESGAEQLIAADENKMENKFQMSPPAPPPVTMGDTSIKKIQQGEIAFATENIGKSSAWIKKQTEHLKGYISNENLQVHTEKIENEITIRIPAASLQILIDSITSQVGKLDNKQISVEDVTAEYIDLEVRINNKRALENRYKQLLQKANKVADMIAIEEQIGNLREEIEAAEGRWRLMKNQVALSTLRIQMYEIHATPSQITNQIKEGFLEGWRGFIQVCMLLVYSWVFLLLAVIGWIIYRRRKLNRKK